MRLTTVELVEHPLDGCGATSYALDLPQSAVVADIVPAGARVVVMVDDVVVAPADWQATPIAGRTVRVTAAAAGDLFRPLLQIAVAAAAAYVGGPWGAAIAIGGGLAIQLFLPPPQPDFGGASDGATLYSLSGASSRARLYEALPLVIGTHRVVADIGARARSYFSGQDHWLEGVWHFGLGGGGLVIDEDTLAFGDIPFAVLDDLDYEIAERPSNVAGSVDTVAGGTITTTALTRQASAGTTRVEIDITGRLFGLSKKGSSQNRSVPIEVVIGASTHALTLTNAAQEPYRTTLAWDLAAAGAPQVSVRRTQEPSSSNRTYDDLELAAVKFIQPDTATYPGQVRLGVRVRASGQLQGQLPPLHAIASQHAAVYADGAWSDTLEATSNPAAQLRQYALGYRAGGALLAGMGLAAAEIDDAELGRWYDYCNTRGLQCNAVLQGGATHDSVLRMLAECGDAHVSWATGRLSVVWEDVARVPSVMIGPQHIVAGSMSLEYAFDRVDEVVVQFVDPDLDWALNPIRRRRTGVTSVQRSTTTTARGVTSAAQAARAANRLIASAEHRARRFTWRMGADGARPFAGCGGVGVARPDFRRPDRPSGVDPIRDGPHARRARRGCGRPPADRSSDRRCGAARHRVGGWPGSDARGCAARRRGGRRAARRGLASVQRCRRSGPGRDLGR